MGTAVMGMGEAVLMIVGVMPRQCIRNHQRRPGDHNDKRRKIGPCQHFLKETLNKSPRTVGGKFCARPRYKNLEIHKVFPRFLCPGGH